VILRPATLADLPALRTLEQQTETAAHWSELDYAALFAPEAPKRITLVACLPNRVDLAGFLIARCGTDDWEIENVVVAREHRRRGLGAALLREILRLAQEHGAASLMLEVRDSNTPARRLYEHFGFAEIARRRNYYNIPEEDALLLKLSLAKI
jgi:ribosomal-protein-alanine acetyltransferase